MTDRINGFIVTLDKRYRIDDMEDTQNAIKCIKGVISVQPIIDDFNTVMVREQVKNELIGKLFEVLK